MSTEVHVIPDFLSKEECEWFSAFHKVMWRYHGVTFSDRKILYVNQMIDYLADEKAYNSTDPLKKILADIACNIRKYDERAYPNYSHITGWVAPIRQPMHFDFPQHAWTSIIYLNEDFVGGSTIIEDQNIQPEQGMMVLFEGCKLNHGVENVTHGTRYTISTWYKSFMEDNQSYLYQIQNK